MKELDGLVQRMESGKLLSRAMFDIDLDTALDERDRPDFDDQWVRVNELVESGDPAGDEAAAIDRLRKAAYLATFEITESADAAGDVSDDFGLLAAALVAGVEDPWLNALWLEYQNERFPHGKLKRVKGQLGDLVK